MSSELLYVARRDAYAAFLTAAADAESSVAWHRLDGRFPDGGAAVAAVEGVGPVGEARETLERLAAMHKDGGLAPDWKAFKAAREAFVVAAAEFLKASRRA
ncbi:hypothetical protein [Streptomyces niveus]|uniref:hypothetical protein n=1 Tax=Streptomyces niveus TaxID=193462 RepID=UPI0033E713CF